MQVLNLNLTNYVSLTFTFLKPKMLYKRKDKKEFKVMLMKTENVRSMHARRKQ